MNDMSLVTRVMPFAEHWLYRWSDAFQLKSNQKNLCSNLIFGGIEANTEEIASGIAGGVAIVVIIVGLIIYRNWRYEQELDSLLWKIDYKDIQIPDLPTASSGLGKAPRVKIFTPKNFINK